jgi:hypothetical protein
LLLSDPMVESLKARTLSVTVDSQGISSIKPCELAEQAIVINIPKGPGEHVWKLELTQ